MAINDVVQARIIGTWHGQTTLGSFYYLAQSGPGNVVPFLDEFRIKISNGAETILSAEYTTTRLEAQRVSPLPLTFHVVIAINTPGAIAGASVPTSVAVVLQKHTQFAGRKYRGRWFWPGLSASHQATSQLNATGQGFFNSLATQCAAPLNDTDGTTWIPILRHGYAPGTGVLTYTPITEVIASPILRNQRRRQIGKGK